MRTIRIRSIRSSVSLVSALSFAILLRLPSSANPPARDVTERAADQYSYKWVVGNLPRSGRSSTTTRIADVLRDTARL